MRQSCLKGQAFGLVVLGQSWFEEIEEKDRHNLEYGFQRKKAEKKSDSLV